MSLAILILAVLLSAGCAPGIITEEFCSCLTDITDQGIANTDEQIIAIDSRLVKTQQTCINSSRCTAGQCSGLNISNPPREGSWRIEVEPGALALLANERYGISRLEIVLEPHGNTYFIDIVDMTTGKVVNPEELKHRLGSEKEALEKSREQIIEVRNLAVFVINGSLEYYSAWRVKQSSPEIFLVRGAALGWDERFVSGEWAYERGNARIIPSGTPAERLQNILLCR